jgi:FdhD protein
MRTPGNDFELAAGFLFAEGLIGSLDDIARIAYCSRLPIEERYNAVSVELRSPGLPSLEGIGRQGVVTSACGVCGKRTIHDLAERGVEVVRSSLGVADNLLLDLPQRLRENQRVFESTGGLHAAGLFSSGGQVEVVREDVGRHNALDKLLGWALLQGRLPLDKEVLMLSGRVSYELVTKAAVAGISIVAAVSAPSSMAVSLAQRFGITLAGFVRKGSFNLYTHPERVRLRDGIAETRPKVAA